MNEAVDKSNFDKFLQIKKTWPNHRIESHIMSKNFLKNTLIIFSKYSDVIYFHFEIDNKIERIKNIIETNGIKPGLVLHATKKYNDLENLIGSFEEILILCIEKPGGQVNYF